LPGEGLGRGIIYEEMTGLRRIIETLHPAYFDIVMATGIVAIAAHVERIRLAPLLLTYLNIGLCGLLLAMNALRLVWQPAAFRRDLSDFERGPGFLTLVAGLAVLGSQAVTIWNFPMLAEGLWIASLALWVCVNYAVLFGVIVNVEKPRFRDAIGGSWLLFVVATQSVAGLGAQLAGVFGKPNALLFFAASMWLAGGMLYIWLISLIFYRFAFFPFGPESFLPTFWINMGAMAVSALTGTTLVGQAQSASYLADLLPFLKGLTMLLWATASWWIPLLALLAGWQHLVKKLNRPYSQLYWGAVFPLGMYTVSTYEVARMTDLPFLLWIPRVFVYIALAAWLATFASMLRSMVAPRRE
jgi:tellurite resistance protein TehA-like permease